MTTTPPLPLSCPSVKSLAAGSYRRKTADSIRGSGYIVESLEAALWCFERSETYRDAVLRAVNLGDDADTTAAVCGQLAGAFYGASGIPAAWLDRLAMRSDIEGLADRLRTGPVDPRQAGSPRSGASGFD